jgi:Tfp pilus assembly protein PilF
LYDLKDLPGSLKELRAAVALDPKNASAHRLLARIYSQQNDDSSAERELRLALAAKPSADLHFELGSTLGQLGKLDAAAAEFRTALQLDPHMAPAHTLLGVALRRQGDRLGALAQFRKAVQIDPNDAESEYDLGMELKSLGDSAGAIAAFQKAIASKPDFEKAHYGLGIALRAQGQAEAGKKELEQVNALHDFRTRLAQSKYLILQGVQALEHQKLDDALALFEKSVEQSPELPTGHYYLGITWEKKGDLARATAAYQKALEMKPDYAQVH